MARKLINLKVVENGNESVRVITKDFYDRIGCRNRLDISDFRSHVRELRKEFGIKETNKIVFGFK